MRDGVRSENHGKRDRESRSLVMDNAEPKQVQMLRCTHGEDKNEAVDLRSAHSLAVMGPATGCPLSAKPQQNRRRRRLWRM